MCLLLALSACANSPSASGEPATSSSASREPANNPSASPEPANAPSASAEVGSGGGTVDGPDGPRVVPPDDGSVVRPDTFTVGGTVNGLIGTVVLENHRGLFLEVKDDGPFAFKDIPTPAGEDYFVKVFNQPFQPQQRCTVANGEGTFSDHDVIDVVVTCV